MALLRAFAHFILAISFCFIRLQILLLVLHITVMSGLDTR